MVAFAEAATWGAFVFVSMIGWGIIVTRILLRDWLSIGWAQKAALGIAWTACVGGLFDLSALISKGTIYSYLGVGVLGALHASVSRPHPRSPERPRAWNVRAISLAVLVGLLLALRVAGSIIVIQPATGMEAGSFHPFDDFQAYLVYPLKMVQTGSMGADPFSLRRTPTHSLGGNAFLQALIVAALPVQSLRIMDVAIGTLVVIGLLWFYMSRLPLPRIAALFVILVFLTIPPPLFNVTSLLIPLALFISLFMIFAASEDPPKRGRAALVGLHVGAICVLKTSLMPAVSLFMAGHAVACTMRAVPRREAFIASLLWGAAALGAVLPWMFDAQRWSGTFVPRAGAYFGDPTLVAGFAAVNGWRYCLKQMQHLPPAPYLYLAVLAAALLVMRATRRVPLAVWTLLAATALGVVGTAKAIGGAANDLHRYMYPFVASALLVALVHTIAAFQSAAMTELRRRVVVLCVISATILLTVASAPRSMRMYLFAASTVARAIGGEQLVSAALQAKYRQLQEAVPPGRTILERMEHPYLFDFRRNRVFLADIPGAAALRPGLPSFRGSEPLAEYLLMHDIRYVAFDYASEAGTPRTGSLADIAKNNTQPWAHAIVTLMFDFHNNLNELGRTRARVFDDGRSFVVDLQQRIDVLALNAAPGTAEAPMTVRRQKSR